MRSIFTAELQRLQGKLQELRWRVRFSIPLGDPAPSPERGRIVAANQLEGRVAGADAWVTDGCPAIADQSAVIGLPPAAAGHAGATWFDTGTHEVLVADAVCGLAEQPPRPAKASATAARKYIFTSCLFVTIWFHLL